VQTIEILLDGGDSLQASFPISVSRAAFPYKDGSPNSLEAGAVEVADTDKWGECFVAPVGRDLYESKSLPDPDPTSAFQETEIYLMASQPNTIVTVPSRVLRPAKLLKLLFLFEMELHRLRKLLGVRA
jgi:hypothetical protein